MRKIISCVLAMCLAAALLAGCGDSFDTSKVETYELTSGASITAPEGMRVTKVEGYTDTLDSDKMAVLLLREDRPSGWNLLDYADAVKQNNTQEFEFAFDDAGNLAASYCASPEGEEMFYYVTVCGSEDAFWLCQFTCRSSDRELLEPLFPQWSKSLNVPGGRIDDPEKVIIRSVEYDLSCGLTVSGPNRMEELQQEGYAAFCASNTVGLCILLDERDEGETLEDYAALISEINGYDAMEADAYGNLATAYYSDDGVYWYYTSVHEALDGFCILQYYCYAEDQAVYESYFPAWSAEIHDTAA